MAGYNNLNNLANVAGHSAAQQSPAASSKSPNPYYESLLNAKGPNETEATSSYKIIGEAPGISTTSPFFIDSDNLEDNILSRKISNPIFDIEDVEEANDMKIFELLPKQPIYPDTAPLNIDVYAANWARVINFGGVKDKTKDPRIDSLKDWAEVNSNNEITGIGNWVERHKWPATSTLDPTYMFFTGDPALFYASNVISHYEPNEEGVMEAVLVPEEDIEWLLDGKPVATGWYLDLSALDRTVEVFDGQAVIVPRLLTCVAKNNQGEIRKEIKFAAVNSDNAGDVETIAGLGINEVDNFSSTFEGQFVPDNDPESENYKGVYFWPDPRYGPRKVYVRFEWGEWRDSRFSRRRKFKKNKAKFTVDGVKIFNSSGIKVMDDFKNRDKKAGRHQDALKDFPDIFNNNGRLKKKYRNKGGDMLGEIGVEDFTQGRKSAIFYDEVSRYNSKLFVFEKKPGPFSGEIILKKRVRRGGWFSKKIPVHYKGGFDFTNGEFDIDTAWDQSTQTLQAIDLGVIRVDYTKIDS